eukprot:8874615-Pyramimonas_sp.AAC.1
MCSTVSSTVANRSTLFQVLYVCRRLQHEGARQRAIGITGTDQTLMQISSTKSTHTSAHTRQHQQEALATKYCVPVRHK